MKKTIFEFYGRYKLLIRPAVLAILSLIILTALIIPQLLAFFSGQGKLRQNQSRLGLLEAKSNDLQSIDEEDFQQKLRVAFMVLPKEKDIPESMANVTNILSISGVVLSDARVVDSPGRGSANSFQLVLTIIGNMQSIRKVLVDLTESPRIVRVEGIDARAAKQGTEIQADITTTVFYEPAPAVSLVVDQPLPTLTSDDQKIITQLAASLGPLVRVGSEAAPSIPLGKVDPFE